MPREERQKFNAVATAYDILKLEEDKTRNPYTRQRDIDEMLDALSPSDLKFLIWAFIGISGRRSS